MQKAGWVSPKGEIIPVIPPKTYETTIIEWALKNNVEFDTNKNPYNSFIEVGYIWFLGSSVVTQEELNFTIKRKIEDYTGEKITPQNILIFNTQENRRER